MELSREEKITIISQHIHDWETAAYSAAISARVADRIQDETMHQRAVAQAERAERALDVLREELKGLGTETA